MQTVLWLDTADVVFTDGDVVWRDLPHFPTLSISPRMEDFVDEFSDETVLIDSYASGYPLANPQFTFDLRNFEFTLHPLSDADKTTLMDFYNNNKDSLILWTNEQDGELYVVVFTERPTCRLTVDKDKWQVNVKLKQVDTVY